MKIMTKVALFTLVLAVLAGAAVSAQENGTEYTLNGEIVQENGPELPAPEEPAAPVEPAVTVVPPAPVVEEPVTVVEEPAVTETAAPVVEVTPSERVSPEWFRGFSAKIEITANLVQWHNQQMRGDGFVEEAEMPREHSVYFMRNGNYDDTDASFNYDDPFGRFGAQIGFDFPGGLLTQNFRIGDVFAWAHITPYFRFKMGKFTDRVIDKVGGDKDLGVFYTVFENDDMNIVTNDSLGLGSSAIGFLPTLYSPKFSFGQFSLSGFFAPNEYHLGRRINPANTTGGTQVQLPVIVPAYATYRFGGAFKYEHDIFSLGITYRTHHSEPETSGIDIGSIHKDLGIYGVFNLGAIPGLSVVDGLKLGLGYSTHLDYLEGIEDIRKERAEPQKQSFHIDLFYGDIIPGLSVGIFNNYSYYTWAKEDIHAVFWPESPLSMWEDEVGSVLYNEVSISYNFAHLPVSFTMPPITLSVMARNYHAIVESYQGGSGLDYGRNIFIVETLLRYNLTDWVQVRGGFKYETNIYNTPVSSVVRMNNNQMYSIPIGIVVNWQ